MPPHLYTCTDSPFIPDTELSSSNEKMKKTQSFLWRHSQSNDKHGVSQGDERYSVDRVQATWGPKGGSGHLQEIKTTLLLLLRWPIIFTSTGATNWSWFAQDLPILGIESPKSQETPLLGANQRADRPVSSCQPTTGAAADLFHHFMLLHFMCDRSPEALRSWTSHGCAPTHLRSPLKETSHVCTCASWRAKFFPVCHLAELCKNPRNRLGGVYIYSDLTDGKLTAKAETPYWRQHRQHETAFRLFKTAGLESGSCSKTLTSCVTLHKLHNLCSSPLTPLKFGKVTQDLRNLTKSRVCMIDA